MEKIIKLICIISFQCLITLSIVALYHHKTHNEEKDFIVVDFQKIMKVGLTHIASQSLTENQQKKALNKFSIDLRDKLQQLSLEHNSTVLISEVVLAGARDETETILAQLQQRVDANEND